MKKKGIFDCAMGSYDGAECCELIGLYMLNKLTERKHAVFQRANLGLYHDDGLAVDRIRGRPGSILDLMSLSEQNTTCTKAIDKRSLLRFYN